MGLCSVSVIVIISCFPHTVLKNSKSSMALCRQASQALFLNSSLSGASLACGEIDYT